MLKVIPSISKKIMVLMTVILFAVSMILFISPGKIYGGGPWYVDLAGTDDSSHGTNAGADAFKTIQYAINAATSGDTINVAAGIYTFNTTSNNTVSGKGLTITGESKDTVILNDTYSPPRGNGIFSIQNLPGGAEVKLENMTLKTPSRAINTSSNEGTVSVSNCRFIMTGNGGPMVSADNVANTNFTFNIENCIFETETTKGGSSTTFIYTSQNSITNPAGTFNINNNVFRGSARGIGAIATGTKITGNTFELNLADEYAIQIYARNDVTTLSTIEITDNTFSNPASGAKAISIKQLGGKIPTIVDTTPLIRKNIFGGIEFDLYLWNAAGQLSFKNNVIDVTENYNEGSSPNVGFSDLSSTVAVITSPYYIDAAMATLSNYVAPAAPTTPAPIGQVQQTVGAGTVTVNTSGASATVTGSGGQTVTIEGITSDAASAGGFSIAGATIYVYLHIDSPEGIEKIQFTILGGAGIPRWWNGSVWIECSDYTIDASGNVTVTITNSTTPSPSDLTGTVFTVFGKPWVRTMPMTCYRVWVNEDNKFQFIFWYPYRDNNWVKIYDMSGKEVYSIDMPYDNPNLIVDLPNGMYTVKTFTVGSTEPIQTFVIGK